MTVGYVVCNNVFSLWSYGVVTDVIVLLKCIEIQFQFIS